MQDSAPAELSSWLWLWSPLVVFVLLLILNYVDAEFYRQWVQSEQGFVELATPLVLLAGMVAGVKIIALRKQMQHGWMIIWTTLVALACVYFAGEELSWGQQIFHWQTPEAMRAINDQGETNIHNISSWFDQKPRLLLELWVLFGGVILPIGRKVNNKNYAANDWRYWFWPAGICFPAALIAIMVKLPERVKDVFNLDPFTHELRYSELQELYFAVFLSLYLVSIQRRLSRLSRG